jgi:hypothetical protein
MLGEQETCERTKKKKCISKEVATSEGKPISNEKHLGFSSVMCTRKTLVEGDVSA